jgi:hypothetical protein
VRNSLKIKETDITNPELIANYNILRNFIKDRYGIPANTCTDLPTAKEAQLVPIKRAVIENDYTIVKNFICGDSRSNREKRVIPKRGGKTKKRSRKGKTQKRSRKGKTQKTFKKRKN